MTTSPCPVAAPWVVAQQADDVHVLLDTSSGHYFTLDEVGGRVWQLCDGRALDGIVDQICEEYDAPRGNVEADVLELLDALSAQRLVTLER